MNKPKYTTKLSHPMVEGLEKIIQLVLEIPCEEDDDRLHYAALAEIKTILYKKLAVVQKEYQITFSHVQAIALQLLSAWYVKDKTTFAGNRLHQIANEIEKHFA